MKITKAKFITGVPSLKECPQLNKPEFALIGRSNVGKSSFINAVVNIKGLAKTSNTPGRTRLINLFDIQDMFVFADLPGYGFAKVSGSLQNKWRKNMENYLLNRNSIASLIQLIDSRIPVQNNDIQMHEWIIHNNLPYFVIAVKTDGIPKTKIKSVCNKLEKQFNCEVFPFSKFNSSFNNDILDKIEKIVKNYNNLA